MTFSNEIENGTTLPSLRVYSTKFSMSTSNIFGSLPGMTASANFDDGSKILDLDLTNKIICIDGDWTNRKSLSNQNLITLKIGNIVKSVKFKKIFGIVLNGEPATRILLADETDVSDLFDFVGATGTPGATGTSFLNPYPQNDFAYNDLSSNFTLVKEIQDYSADLFSATFAWNNSQEVSRNVFRWRALPTMSQSTQISYDLVSGGTYSRLPSPGLSSSWGYGEEISLLGNIVEVDVLDGGSFLGNYPTLSVDFPGASGASFSVSLTNPYGNPVVYSMGSFVSPSGLDLDSSSNVYVSDSAQSFVEKISFPGGSFSYGGFGYSTPSSINVDLLGNVYVSDLGNDKIYKLTGGIGGSQSEIVSSSVSPSSVTSDSNGFVYFSDIGDGTVKRVSSMGGTVSVIASGFINPVSVNSDAAGNVYVADVRDGVNGAVYKIPAIGGTYSLIGHGFSSLNSITVDILGNVYVCYSTNKIGVMDARLGYPLFTVNSGDYRPKGISVDQNLNLFIIDMVDNTVKELPFNPVRSIASVDVISGGLGYNDQPTFSLSDVSLIGEPKFNALMTIGSVTQLARGYDYFEQHPIVNLTGGSGAGGSILTSNSVKSGGSVDYVTVIDPGTGLTEGSQLIFSEAGPTDSGASGFVHTKRGVIQQAVITDSGLGYASVPSVSTNLNEFVTVGGGFFGAYGIAVDSSNNIYVADFGSNFIEVIPGNGEAPFAFDSITEAVGIFAEKSGNLLVTGSGNGTIMRFSPKGELLETLLTSLSFPTGIAVDSKGNIYVADYGSGKIIVIPINGQKPYNVGYNFTNPLGICFDSNDNLYIADADSTYIVKISSDGAVTQVGSNLIAPFGVAVDDFGNVFVVDSSLPDLIMIRSSDGVQMSIGVTGSSSGLLGVALNGLNNVLIMVESTQSLVEYQRPSVLEANVSLFSDWNYVEVDPSNPTCTINDLNKYLEYEWQVYSAETKRENFTNFSASQTFKFS